MVYMSMYIPVISLHYDDRNGSCLIHVIIVICMSRHFESSHSAFSCNQLEFQTNEAGEHLP